MLHRPSYGVLLGQFAAVLTIAGAGGMTPTAPGAIARISPEQAEALALNHLRTTDGGLLVDHPRYEVGFTRTGIELRPRAGGASWRWSWRYGGRLTGARPPVARARRPVAERRTSITYDRGPVLERYLLRANSIEQESLGGSPRPRRIGSADRGAGERCTDLRPERRSLALAEQPRRSHARRRAGSGRARSQARRADDRERG